MLFLQWQSSSSHCNSPISTCSFSRPNQDNWVITQHICLWDAKELFFDVSFRFRRCALNPECENDFITLHRYCVNEPVNDFKIPSNYVLLNDTVEDSTLRHRPGSTSVINEVKSLVRPKGNRCYFGFRDQGTCGSIERIIIYYTECRSRQVELVYYPTFANPPKNGPDEVFEAQCVCNAHPVTSLRVIASASDSTCVDEAEGGARCECDAGYQIAADRLSCDGK